MLTVISPAKTLDLDPVAHTPTDPRFPADTSGLVNAARRQGIAGLRDLMGISEPLARLNRDRYRDWDLAPAKPAAFAFAGDTYLRLEASTLSDDALRRAQTHLRILSGLYGLLRPLDGIRPYRLEMGIRLKTRRGPHLYAYWGDRIAEALTEDAERAGARHVLNCASREYFAAADRPAQHLPVITPTFLEDRPGGARVIGFAAKRARGAMARFVVEQRIEDPADLRAFDAGGYVWQPSPPDAPVFLRPGPAGQPA